MKISKARAFLLLIAVIELFGMLVSVGAMGVATAGITARGLLGIGLAFLLGPFSLGLSAVLLLRIPYLMRPLLLIAVAFTLSPATRMAVYALLKPLVSPVCTFVNIPEPNAGRWGQGLTAGKMRECVWIKPELVARFDFLEWTGANRVRHIKFIAMRDDKDPRKVVREK